MAELKRITSNIMYLGIGDLVSKALQFVIMISAARLLAPQSFGTFSFALSLSFIFIILTDMGIRTFYIREVARDKKKATDYFYNASMLKIGIAFVVFLLVLLFIKINSFSLVMVNVLIIMSIFSIMTTFTELCYGVFRAFEQMKYDMIVKVIRMLLLTPLALYVLLSTADVLFFTMMFLLVEAVTTIIAFIFAQRFLKKRPKYSTKTMGFLLQRSWPFGLALVFGGIYFYIDSIMLGIIKTESEVALYAAAYNIALALLFIPTVYANALYPALSRFYINKKAKLLQTHELSIKYLSLISLPLSLLFIFKAEEIISLLYTNVYAESALALQIIALFIWLKFLNFHQGNMLSAMNNQKKRLWSQATTAVVNILLNLLLIPSFGFLGAAIATLLTEIVLFILYYTFVGLTKGKHYVSTISAKLGIPLLGYALILISPLPFLLSLLAALGAFIVLVFLFKVIDNQDTRFIKTVLFNGKLS